MKTNPGTGSTRVRVLINAMHARSGGGATYLRNILTHLVDDPRLELHLFLHHDQVSQFPAVDERVTVRTFGMSRSFWAVFWWEQVTLARISRSMSADVTFSPANFGPIFARNPVIMLRNAFSVGNEETRFIKRLYWKIIALLTAASLLTSKRAIAVSQYARDSLSFGGMWGSKNKIAVVYHGVNPVFAPGEKTANVEPNLLSVSDIYIQKNLHTLIEAMPIILRSVPGLKLKLAGRPVDAAYHDRIVKLIKELNLQDDVIFLGHQRDEELVVLYRDCTAFVFPSTIETFGNPLVEAMSCGAPVACSNTAAMPEIAGNGAVLFDPSKAEDMANSIIRLLEDSALAKLTAERGRSRSNIFSWETTAQKTADILVEAGRGP